MTEQPKVTYLEDEHVYMWEGFGLEIVVERFREERGTLVADVTPRSAAGDGFLPGDKLNLGSARSIKMYANTLESRGLLSGDDWFNVLAQAAKLSSLRYREGTPPVDLWTDDTGPASRYLVRPLMFDDAVNIVYGSGDSGKSVLSLLVALAVASGEEVAGLIAERSGPVIYCDWEDSPNTHQERLRALCNEQQLDLGAGRLIYRRMDASLRESAREIRKLIATTGAIMAVVDSVGMACGGDPSSAEHVIQTMLAARSLGVPVLAVHHITKDAKDKSNPYGSVYAANEARMSWYVESERSGMNLMMVATNYKANRGAHQERQSFNFTFTENDLEVITSIAVTRPSFMESRAVGDGGHKWKIAEILKQHGKLEAAEIATIAELTNDTTRRTLNRNPELFGKEKCSDGKTLWWVLAQDGGTSENLSRDASRAGRDVGGPSIGARVPAPTPAEYEEEEITEPF